MAEVYLMEAAGKRGTKEAEGGRGGRGGGRAAEETVRRRRKIGNGDT